MTGAIIQELTRTRMDFPNILLPDRRARTDTRQISYDLARRRVRTVE